MRYLMLISGTDEAWTALSEAQVQAEYEKIGAWMERHGVKDTDGAELEAPAAARTIRPGPVVTDGPFVELKEAIGGIIFIEADTLDAAVEIASGWPGIDGGWTDALEVRPTIVHE